MKWLNDYRMRLVLTGIVAGIVFGGGRARADFVWAQKADMPTTRFQHSASIVAGKIYVIGGWHAIGEWNPQWEALTRVDEYDPSTDIWTRKADMPTGRGHTNACVVDGKIHVIGGDAVAEPISIVEVYDPATDTWTQQTELPTKRRQFTTSVVDGIIYVIGGYMPSISGRTGLVEAYDPTTDTWTRKADMPRRRTFTSSCVVDGKIYVIGGAWQRKAVEAYDPATDTWTIKKVPMPTPRYLLDTSVVGGKIYAIGGYGHSVNGPIYATAEVYDPQTNTWTKGVDIPTTMAGMSTSVVDGKIYVIGGTVATHPGEHWVLTSAVYANEPIVDFNGDSIVDASDMCIVVDHWGENYSLCDIGPTPFGDGIVDVEDLIVLSEYLFKEVDDPTLVAHWKLDETEGSIAYDSAGNNNASVYGGAIWQPTEGKIGGALQFDGVDDWVFAGHVKNLSGGTFSILAWIKGGVPNQAIVSQATSANWLMIDVDGKLATELGDPSSSTGLLVSETPITDGEWHNIALVRDTAQRALYVDNVLVAEDALADQTISGSGLNIGVGKNYLPGTYWAGMIDEVRIYNRAVKP